MANNESSGWVSSMETMLGSVTNEKVKPCSIFRVPEQLRKSEKEAEAYTPKVVSIGPLHKGTKTELLYMEEIKYHCMLSLLLRTDDALKRFSECSKAILKLDDSVRAFYVDAIKFNNYELAKIMLLDGCFLLELLISNAEQSDPDISTTLRSFSGLKSLHIKSHLSESDADAAAEVRNKGEVLSDLKLIENQIPLLVLVWLFQLLFIIKESDIEKTYVPVRNTIHRLALLLFGCSPSPVACDKNRAHLVELVHTFLTEKQQEHHHSITIKTSRTSGKRVSVKRISVKRNYETAPELECCAARFKAARIEIKPVEEQSEGMKHSNDDVIFFCYTSFTDKTLENSEYVQMIKVFNEYSGGCGNCGMVGHKCRRVWTNKWYTIRTWWEILKRDHTPTVWKTIGVIAAILLVLLTIAQTVFKAIDL